MAATGTHIILAKKIYDTYCSDKNEPEFFRGTEFPDIRYIANIDRNTTHFESVSLDEIIKSDSFTAGLKTHSLVDLTREQYVREANLYKLLPESKYLTQVLKAYEDQLIYDQIDNWQKYVDFMDQISDQELTFKIDKQTILEWHKIVQGSFRSKPTDQTIITFLSQKMRLPDSEREITEVLHKLQQIKEIKQIILGYINSFEQLILKFK